MLLHVAARLMQAAQVRTNRYAVNKAIESTAAGREEEKIFLVISNVRDINYMVKK